MSVAQKHHFLLQRLLLIEDPQERLSAILERARKLPPLTEEERTEEYRVPGCISRVWVASETFDGRCRFKLDADSGLVRALAHLVCEIFQDGTPSDILAHSGDILEDLKITSQLTPTRRNGLAQVRERIRALAAKALKDAI
jgi:cysteine desulfuration protein SufE